MSGKPTENLWICPSESPFKCPVVSCLHQAGGIRSALQRSEMEMNILKESEKRLNFQSNLQFWQRDWSFLIIELRLWCKVTVGFLFNVKWPEEAHSLLVFNQWQRKDAFPWINLKGIVRDKNKDAFWLPDKSQDTAYIYICGSSSGI